MIPKGGKDDEEGWEFIILITKIGLIVVGTVILLSVIVWLWVR